MSANPKNVQKQCIVQSTRDKGNSRGGQTKQSRNWHSGQEPRYCRPHIHDIHQPGTKTWCDSEQRPPPSHRTAAAMTVGASAGTTTAEGGSQGWPSSSHLLGPLVICAPAPTRPLSALSPHLPLFLRAALRAIVTTTSLSEDSNPAVRRMLERASGCTTRHKTALADPTPGCRPSRRCSCRRRRSHRM